MKLRLHATEKRVKALGPGIRYAIWTQGCHKRCKNCISKSTWDVNGGYEEFTERLAEEIVNESVEGITISGGEPFLQAEALVDLIQKIRSKCDMGVIIYTGNTLEELSKLEDIYVKQLLNQCDLLIDGTYEDDLNDGMNLRGSSNQKVIPLTERYREEAKMYGTQKAQIEFFTYENKTRMVGIPSKEMWNKLQLLMK